MKNTIENSRPMTGAKKEVNVQEQAIQVLKTLVLFDKAYGLTYCERILRGVDIRFWKHADHPHFETYGSLNDCRSGFVRKLIHNLIDLGYISVSKPQYNTITITDKGRGYLDSPEELIFQEKNTSFSEKEYLLSRFLMDFRKEKALLEKVPQYEIFTDFTADRIAFEAPQNLDELLKVPGMTPYKADSYGHGILSKIRETDELTEAARRKRIIAKAKSRKHQYVKQLFNEGKKIHEIAEAAGVKENTVNEYLRNLHVSGQIDLKPWIEKTFDGKVLHKGSEYFSKAAAPTLTEGFAVLGIDYETLKYCKLYVSGFSQKEEKISVPA